MLTSEECVSLQIPGEIQGGLVRSRSAQPTPTSCRFRLVERPFIVRPQHASRREGAHWGFISRSAIYARASAKAARSKRPSLSVGLAPPASSIVFGSGRAGCRASTSSTPSGPVTSGRTETSTCWSPSSGMSGAFEDQLLFDCRTIPISRLAKEFRHRWSARTEAAVHPENRSCPARAERVDAIARSR